METKEMILKHIEHIDKVLEQEKDNSKYTIELLKAKSTALLALSKH